MVPAHPTADFVVGQAHFPLGLLKQFLDTVPSILHPHQLLQRSIPSVAQRVPRPWLASNTAHHHHPLDCPHTPLLILGLHHRRQHPHHQRALLSRPNAHLSPARRRLLPRPNIDTRKGPSPILS